MTNTPIDAVLGLSKAFRCRDLGAALACFVPGDDIGYSGSELEERAVGRNALIALFGDVFARDETYAWQPGTVRVHEYGEAAYVYAEADGVVRNDNGTEGAFPYRVTGIVERVDGRWLWRHCQGWEPQA